LHIDLVGIRAKYFRACGVTSRIEEYLTGLFQRTSFHFEQIVVSIQFRREIKNISIISSKNGPGGPLFFHIIIDHSRSKKSY